MPIMLAVRHIFTNKLSNKKRRYFLGFTLPEILIIVAIIGILVVVSIMFLNPLEQIKKGTDANKINSLDVLNDATNTFYHDVECFPQQTAMENVLLNDAEWSVGQEKYLRKVPKNPDCTGTDKTKCFNYITDSSSSCPQWSIVAVKLSRAESGGPKCSTQIYQDCVHPVVTDGEPDKWICYVSGIPTCSTASLPSGPAPTTSSSPTSTTAPATTSTPTPTPTSTPTPIPLPTCLSGNYTCIRVNCSCLDYNCASTVAPWWSGDTVNDNPWRPCPGGTACNACTVPTPTPSPTAVATPTPIFSGPTPTPYGANFCNYSSQANRYIIPFNTIVPRNPILANNGISDAEQIKTSGSFLPAGPIPPGNYRVRLVSWDHHTQYFIDNGFYPYQPREQWILILTDGAGGYSQSQPNDDLPDAQDFIEKIVNNNFLIATPMINAIAHHYYYPCNALTCPDQQTYNFSNSIVPICAVLDRL